MGYAGYYITQNTNQFIGWITGLDAAGPCFPLMNAGKHDAKTMDRLSPKAATLVEAVHTNGDTPGFGTLDRLGHYDFYPDGGETQAGCPNFPLAILNPKGN